MPGHLLAQTALNLFLSDSLNMLNVRQDLLIRLSQPLFNTADMAGLVVGRRCWLRGAYHHNSNITWVRHKSVRKIRLCTLYNLCFLLAVQFCAKFEHYVENHEEIYNLYINHQLHIFLFDFFALKIVCSIFLG